MRVSRTKRHKHLKKRRRQFVAGMTSILSIATVGVSHLPASTYGLATSTVHNLPDQDFKALSVFPATIQEMVKRGEEAANQVNNMMGASQELFNREFIIPDIEELLPPIIDDPAINDPMIDPPIVDEEITNNDEAGNDLESDDNGNYELIAFQMQIDVLNGVLETMKQKAESLKGSWEVASSYAGVVWGIYAELLKYDREFANAESIRAKLLLDAALEDVKQYAREVSSVVRLLEDEITYWKAEIQQMEEDIVQLTLSLEALSKRIEDSKGKEDANDENAGEESDEETDGNDDEETDENSGNETEEDVDGDTYEETDEENTDEDVEDGILSEKESSDQDENAEGVETGEGTDAGNSLDEPQEGEPNDIEVPEDEEDVSKDPINIEQDETANETDFREVEVGNQQIRIVYGTHNRS